MLIKRLKAYRKDEIDGALFGFGVLRAKNYSIDKYGHLFLFSINIGNIRLIKKLFI